MTRRTAKKTANDNASAVVAAVSLPPITTLEGMKAHRDNMNAELRTMQQNLAQLQQQSQVVVEGIARAQGAIATLNTIIGQTEAAPAAK